MARSSSNAPWPPVHFEELPWVGTIDVPRRWQSTYSGPYRAAIAPKIARLTPVISSSVAAIADEATAELARFDAETGADLAPFASILLRSEAAASSRIEQLTASARSVALAELGDTSKRNATAIVGNSRAMTAALDLADRLDGSAILAMHAALMEHHDPTIAGSWRSTQVWIGSSSYGPHTADFVPPHQRRIAAAIEDLVRFMRRDDLPVLAQAALAHAHFETIHPFVDGNGRTGRALVHSLLRAKRLTRQVTVPVSAGLITNTDRYFDALTAYRSGDITPIIERFSEASFDAVVNGRRLVLDLRQARATWTAAITSRSHATVWRALDVVLQHPVLTNALLRDELGTSAMGAEAAIAELVQIGALEEITGRRRDRRFAAPAVLAALDAFAQRSARRS